MSNGTKIKCHLLDCKENLDLFKAQADGSCFDSYYLPLRGKVVVME